jgi:putative ABC transport system permease protein
MTAILVMFLIFAVLALALSAILTASIIDGLLARQIRQIAVMKAIGARSRQIAGLYLSAVLAIAGVAVLIGLSLGALSGRRFAGVIAGLLNFDIASYDLPLWMIVTLAAGGLGVPVVFALIPIRKAARITIREAISDYGVSRKTFGSDRLGMRPDMRPDMGLNIALMRLAGFDRTLILAMRNAFRRRGRLALTLTLLAAAGAMFLASLSVKNAWDAFITASAQDRGYDLELRFDRPAPTDAVLAAAAAAPGVSKVEPWSVTFTAAARPDGLTVVRTYPDGGHANLEFRSLPAPDRLSHLVFLEGRAPEPGDDGAVLINQGAWSLLGRPRVGDTVALTVEGRAAFYRLAGVVRQIVTLPTVFAPAASYQRATRTEGKTNAIRAVTTNHDAAGISAAASAIETRLQSLGVRVTLSMSETQFGGAVSGHVRILVVSLMVMSGLMAVVGLLGLASAQGTSVAERTREFGVMRAIGGVNAVIIRNIIVEGVFIGLISIVFAGLLALPFAWGIGALVGTLSFGLPLPLTLSLPALGLWLGVVICGTIAASLVPARNAAKLTIRETLAYS